MASRSADTLERHTWVGGGLDAYIYHVALTIVVKTVRRDRTPEEEAAAAHPFLKEIAFYQRRNESQYPCQDIVECFPLLPDHLFLSYCPHKAIAPRFFERQERETGTNGHFGLLIRATEYEDPGPIARWIQQITSALEYVEKLGFCHSDLHASNCLLDEKFNVKLADFGRATTIGQLPEGALPPRAMPIVAGPLAGTYKGYRLGYRVHPYQLGTGGKDLSRVGPRRLVGA